MLFVAVMRERRSLAVIYHRIVQSEPAFNRPQRLLKRCACLAAVDRGIAHDPHHNAALLGDAEQLADDCLPFLRRPIVQGAVVCPQVVVGRRRDSQVYASIRDIFHLLKTVAVYQSNSSHPLFRRPHHPPLRRQDKPPMSGYILSLVCRLNLLKVAYLYSIILNHKLHKTLITLDFLDITM